MNKNITIKEATITDVSLILQFIKELAEYEQKALHLQMNPHFVFNCLGSISSFIVQNGTDSAIKYLCVSLRRRLIKDMEKDHQVSQSDVLENHINYAETSPETQWMEKEEQTKSQQLLQEAMLKLPKRQQEALHFISKTWLVTARWYSTHSLM